MADLQQYQQEQVLQQEEQFLQQQQENNNNTSQQMQEQQQQIDYTNMDPIEQQTHIQMLQEKLKQLETQLGRENSIVNQRSQDAQIFLHTQNSPNANKIVTQQPPQYPNQYEDWILKQSLSPRKFQAQSDYYQDHKQCTFEPKINQKSVKISKRDPNEKPQSYMVKYLYEDALQRQSKSSNKLKKINDDIQQEGNRSKIGMKSQKIVLKKIEDALTQILDGIEENEFVSFENLGLFFEQLGVFKALQFKKTSVNETSLYLHDRQKIDLDRLSQEMQFHEQIWKILSGDVGKISKRLVFDFAMILLEKRLFVSQSVQLMEHVIQDNQQFIQQQEDQKKEGEQQQDSSQNGQNNNDTQKNNNSNTENNNNNEQQPQQQQEVSWNLEQLVLEFRKLFEDKTNLMEYYGTSKKHMLPSDDGEPQFKPQINQKSKIIDKNNNGDKKRYNLLFEHSKYLREKKIEQKEKLDVQELETCTFQPETNDYNFKEYSNIAENRYEKLYNLNNAKLARQTMKKSNLDIHRQNQEIQQCTFKPKLVSQVPIRGLNEKSVIEEVKGTQQVVQRYQKARDDKDFVDSYWERKRDSYMQHDNTRNTETMPFSFATSKSFRKDRGELLGNVDVNYAKGKKAKIAIYKGDDARKCACNFAKIHGLSEDMTDCLTEMLESYISSFENNNTANIVSTNSDQQNFEKKIENSYIRDGQEEDEQENQINNDSNPMMPPSSGEEQQQQQQQLNNDNDNEGGELDQQEEVVSQSEQ